MVVIIVERVIKFTIFTLFAILVIPIIVIVVGIIILIITILNFIFTINLHHSKLIYLYLFIKHSYSFVLVYYFNSASIISFFFNYPIFIMQKNPYQVNQYLPVLSIIFSPPLHLLLPLVGFDFILNSSFRDK